jgi:hypothetical protein
MLNTPTFADLETALPEYINLKGITEIHDTDLDDDDEAASLAALITGLAQAGIDVGAASQRNRTLVADHHWEEHAREFAVEAGYAQDVSPLDSCIDWEQWALHMKIDYTQVVVASGTFAGDWWTRS